MYHLRLGASWALGLLVAGILLWIADQTLFPAGPERNVVFPTLADASGIALFEPTGRFVTGLLEVLAAVLLILPWTRRAGALLAILVVAGAVAAQVLWLGMQVPLERGAEQTDGGALFYLAIGIGVAALALVFVHPGRRED
jgi:uncharacterized membrane protein